MKFEVCISDNHSFSDINKIVAPYKNVLDINLGINEANIGHGETFKSSFYGKRRIRMDLGKR